MRVLRLYHSGVVDEYRQRERFLREQHDIDVRLVTPFGWPEGGSFVRIDPGGAEDGVYPVATHGRRHPILFWYDRRALRQILSDFQPDIVDIHEEPYSLATAGVLRAMDAVGSTARVCLYTAQNIQKNYPPPFRWFERRALQRAAACYPCSSEAGEVLRRKGFEGDIRVLPLGVTLPESRVRRLGSPPYRLGFVGRLEPYKGGRVAIESLARVAATVDATLEFVGSGSDQPELEAMVERLGLAARVGFAGALTQEAALARLDTYDIVVVPSLTTSSWKEQFGRVPAQAFAAGTPVVASDSGSLPEVLAEAGLVAREGEAADFAEKITSLLSDPAEWQRYSEAGRERAASTLTWERVASGVADMYSAVLPGRERLDPGAQHTLTSNR